MNWPRLICALLLLIAACTLPIGVWGLLFGAIFAFELSDLSTPFVCLLIGAASLFAFKAISHDLPTRAGHMPSPRRRKRSADSGSSHAPFARDASAERVTRRGPQVKPMKPSTALGRTITLLKFVSVIVALSIVVILLETVSEHSQSYEYERVYFETALKKSGVVFANLKIKGSATTLGLLNNGLAVITSERQRGLEFEDVDGKGKNWIGWIEDTEKANERYITICREKTSNTVISWVNSSGQFHRIAVEPATKNKYYLALIGVLGVFFSGLVVRNVITGEAFYPTVGASKHSEVAPVYWMTTIGELIFAVVFMCWFLQGVLVFFGD